MYSYEERLRAVPELLSGLKLARSTYFYNRLRRGLPDKYAQVRGMIADIFHGNYSCYGYRRIDGVLRRDGVRLSEKVVRRLMAEDRLVVKTARRRRFSRKLSLLLPILVLTSCSIATVPKLPAPSADLMQTAPTGSVYLESVLLEQQAYQDDLDKWERMLLRDGLIR